MERTENAKQSIPKWHVAQKHAIHNDDDNDRSIKSININLLHTNTYIKMADIIANTLRDLLLDPNAYIKSEKWNELLQEPGAELDDEQKAEVKNKPTKRYTMKIRFSDRLFRDLYKLSEMFYIVCQHDSMGGKWFPKLPKNKSDSVHKIGKWIAENRIRVQRGDIHTHQDDELKALLEDDKYKDKQVLYYLPQREIIQHFFGIWGKKFDDVFKPTTDDILRLFGIMLTCEDVREFIPDLICSRRSQKGRQNLDAASTRKAAAWLLLLTKFIDEEVIIKFPVKWGHEDFIRRINERAGVDDFYSKHGAFNPNNTERMNLPWTVKLLEIVLTEGRGHYEEMMKSYTMGTGGGPGAPENFADWKERDESYILRYTDQQVAMLYLTIVFMWDKLHDFPLKPAVGPMHGGREDETYSGEGGDGDDSTPAPSSGKSTKGGGNAQLVAALEDMNSQRKRATKDIIAAVMGNGDEAMTGSCTDKQHKLVMQMKETRESINEMKIELKTLRQKRKLCEDKYKQDPSKKKKKKAKKISVECDIQENMIATLTTTLMQYNKELEKLNNSNKTRKTLDYADDNSDSDSDSSISSDESDSNESASVAGVNTD